MRGERNFLLVEKGLEKVGVQYFTRGGFFLFFFFCLWVFCWNKINLVIWGLG